VLHEFVHPLVIDIRCLVIPTIPNPCSFSVYSKVHCKGDTPGAPYSLQKNISALPFTKHIILGCASCLLCG
jgi:hypothetical protein